jgi:hypothetical protein
MFAFTAELEPGTCASQLASHTFYYIIFTSAAFDNPTVLGYYYFRFFVPERVWYFCEASFGSAKTIA